MQPGFTPGSRRSSLSPPPWPTRACVLTQLVTAGVCGQASVAASLAGSGDAGDPERQTRTCVRMAVARCTWPAHHRSHAALNVASVTPGPSAARRPPAQLQLRGQLHQPRSLCCPAQPWSAGAELSRRPPTPHNAARASDAGWMGDLRHWSTLHPPRPFIPRPYLHTHNPIPLIMYKTPAPPMGANSLGGGRLSTVRYPRIRVIPQPQCRTRRRGSWLGFSQYKAALLPQPAGSPPPRPPPQVPPVNIF